MKLDSIQHLDPLTVLSAIEASIQTLVILHVFLVQQGSSVQVQDHKAAQTACLDIPLYQAHLHAMPAVLENMQSQVLLVSTVHLAHTVLQQDWPHAILATMGTLPRKGQALAQFAALSAWASR